MIAVALRVSVARNAEDRGRADARACLKAAKAAGLTAGDWARQHGVDGRSLNAWRMNLAQRGGAISIALRSKPRLVELVPTSSVVAGGRYVVDELEVLRRENAAQRAQTAELIATIAKLNERVGELLAIAQRKQRARTAPPQKTPEPRPVLDADAQKAFDERPRPPALPERTKRTKGPARRTGRSAIPSHLELEEHRLRADGCEHCGSTNVSAADEIVEKKLPVVKEHQRRRVVRRTTCRCRDCGKRITPQSLPAPYARTPASLIGHSAARNADARDPGVHLRGLVRAAVVEDRVELGLLRRVAIDLLEEVEDFRGAMLIGHARPITWPLVMSNAA